MTDVVEVFNRNGIKVADIRATVKRSWAINRIGKAELRLAYNDPSYSNVGALQFGNYLLVRNDKLPDWIGIIDPPRKWGRWQVEVTAYSAEKIMEYRRGIAGDKMSGSAGDIYREIIKRVNTPEATIVNFGDIRSDGYGRSETLTTSDLFSQVRGLAERANQEFFFTPKIDINGNLQILANWHLKQGNDIDFVLEEGRHIESQRNIVTEQDVIINNILAIGDGASSNKKPQVEVTDSDSRGIYGLRQGSESFSGVSQLDTLERNGKEKLNKKKQPRMIFELNALDFQDTWNNMRLGNTLGVRLWSVGFGIDTRIRILGMTYDPDDAYVQIVMDDNT